MSPNVYTGMRSFPVQSLTRGVRNNTIAKVLESVGYPPQAQTITRISERTGINWRRLKPIIHDLFDSQLIDWSFQDIAFRKPEKIHIPRTSKGIDSYWKELEKQIEEEKKERDREVPKKPTFSERFEFGMTHPIFTEEAIPQRDIYLPCYRTEQGQKWLDHYSKHPNSWKKLTEIREEHRLSTHVKPRNYSEEPRSPNEAFENAIMGPGGLFNMDTPMEESKCFSPTDSPL